MRAVIGLACATVLLAGCSSASTDTGAAARPTADAYRAATSTPTWFSIVNPKVQAVEQTITTAQVAVRRPDHRGLVAACRQLTIQVVAVQTAPRSSDSVVRNALRREMAAFARAADQCIAGDLDAAGHTINVGHRYEEIVLRRLHILVPASRGSA